MATHLYFIANLVKSRCVRYIPFVRNPFPLIFMLLFWGFGADQKPRRNSRLAQAFTSISDFSSQSSLVVVGEANGVEELVTLMRKIE